MNRRSFLETLAKAAAGFTILPSALTYKRVWKRSPGKIIWQMTWEKIQLGRVPNDLEFYIAVDTEWECVIKPDINAVSLVDYEVWTRELDQKKKILA